jgi:ribonuclease P protein component
MPRPGDGDSSSRRPSAPAEGAALACPERLKKRAEFLAVGKGRRQHQRCFTMQARGRGEAQGVAPRFGFTVTKKTGNSVIRNRIRRRLREIVRLHAAGDAKPAMDYVLVGRIEALTAGFDDLRREFLRALHKIHSAERKPDR